jgi:mxaJ protein
MIRGCNVDHPEPLLLRPLLAVLLVGVDVAGVVAGTHALRSQRVLRVCADPNNLPFSNEREEGPENGLAALVAEELDARVEYTWWAQRRGLVRNALRANLSDGVMRVPSAIDQTRGFPPLA